MNLKLSPFTSGAAHGSEGYKKKNVGSSFSHGFLLGKQQGMNFEMQIDKVDSSQSQTVSASLSL